MPLRVLRSLAGKGTKHIDLAPLRPAFDQRVKVRRKCGLRGAYNEKIANGGVSVVALSKKLVPRDKVNENALEVAAHMKVFGQFVNVIPQMRREVVLDWQAAVITCIGHNKSRRKLAWPRHGEAGAAEKNKRVVLNGSKKTF
jgi:hypothetical protein